MYNSIIRECFCIRQIPCSSIKIRISRNIYSTIEIVITLYFDFYSRFTRECDILRRKSWCGKCLKHIGNIESCSIHNLILQLWLDICTYDDSITNFFKSSIWTIVPSKCYCSCDLWCCHRSTIEIFIPSRFTIIHSIDIKSAIRISGNCLPSIEYATSIMKRSCIWITIIYPISMPSESKLKCTIWCRKALGAYIC